MEAPTESELLTLQEAADHLRVHYMTAYRWVRLGRLPAFKTGGRLRVPRSELARFIAEREVDVASPGRSGGRTSWESHRAHFYDLLVSGESHEADRLVKRIIADGATAGDVYLRLITPTLERIGAAWAQGDLLIAMEHRATEICLGIMARLTDTFRRPGPSRGTAVALAPAGEGHLVGVVMVADFLRAAGYAVHNLGVNVPLGDLARFLGLIRADVLCVSLTRANPDVYGPVVRVARSGLGAPPVLFGGQGVDAERARAAGGHILEDIEELGPTVAELVKDA